MKNYYYTINGEIAHTQREVNATIKKMKKTPEVIKFETWGNGQTSERNIPVKKAFTGLTIS